MPLPEIWNRIDYARSSCGGNGDFIGLVPGSGAAELPHELVHIAANGAMLGHFDLHRTPGFENGAIEALALDAAGRIVLLVRNVASSKITNTDDEGRPHDAVFSFDHNYWVLTVDDKGQVLTKFSFDDRLVMPVHFALFRSGNVVVLRSIRQGQHGELIAPGAAIFSPTGVMLANLNLPIAAGRDVVAQLQLLPGAADEVFISHFGTEAVLAEGFSRWHGRPKGNVGRARR